MNVAVENGRMRFWGVLFVILAAGLLRLLPHPPNFSPIGAMALFGGAYLAKKHMAVLAPIMALFLSDLILGFHETMLAVYVSVALVSGLGMWLKPQGSLVRTGAASLIGSLMFFTITNFAVWLQSGIYERTWAGLLTCYTAALPFLQTSVAGDFFYVALFFGAWALVEKAVPHLRAA